MKRASTRLMQGKSVVNNIKEEVLPKNPEDFKQEDWVKLAKNIFILQNKIRALPSSFVGYLEKSLQRF